jgi:hypothetical protein
MLDTCLTTTSFSYQDGAQRDHRSLSADQYSDDCLLHLSDATPYRCNDDPLRLHLSEQAPPQGGVHGRCV